MKCSSEYQVLENRRDTGFIRGLSSCANNRSVAADFFGFYTVGLGGGWHSVLVAGRLHRGPSGDRSHEAVATGVPGDGGAGAAASEPAGAGQRGTSGGRAR